MADLYSKNTVLIDIMEEACIFCLDPIKESECIGNPIQCTCNYKAHGSCLQNWFEQKNQYECPICHTVVVQPPVQPPFQVVYVQMPQQPEQQPRISKAQQRCAAMCCFTLMGWAIFVSILEYVKNT